MRKTLDKLAGSGLFHPFTWMMVALLLANDLILKPYYPSWISGKLSDLVLVYLLSLLTFVLLAAVWPMRSAILTVVIGSLPAIFLFGPAKTVPAINAWVVSLQQWLLPFESHFLLDPTDALALLMILPAVVLWKRNRFSPSLKPWRWALLPLMLLVVIGDAAAPQYGIGCLQILENGSILAFSPYQYNAYLSADGGMSWVPTSQQEIAFDHCQLPYLKDGDIFEFTIQDGPLLRFEINQQILESLDGGQSWMPAFHLRKPSEAQIAVMKRESGSYDYMNGPLAVIQDPQHQTVVAAMGMEGVLVRQPDGVWQALPVGEYDPFDNNQSGGAGAFLSLIMGELLLSLLAGIFLISLYSLRWTRRWWRVVKVILAWLGWGLLMLMGPAIADQYLSGMIFVFGIPLAVVWALFCLIDDLRSWKKNTTIPRKRLLLTGGAAALAGMLPFILWAFNIITNYRVAMGIVFGLMLIFAIVGTIWSGKTDPVEEKYV